MSGQIQADSKKFWASVGRAAVPGLAAGFGILPAMGVLGGLALGSRKRTGPPTPETLSILAAGGLCAASLGTAFLANVFGASDLEGCALTTAYTTAAFACGVFAGRSRHYQNKPNRDRAEIGTGVALAGIFAHSTPTLLAGLIRGSSTSGMIAGMIALVRTKPPR